MSPGTSKEPVWLGIAGLVLLRRRSAVTTVTVRIICSPRVCPTRRFHHEVLGGAWLMVTERWEAVVILHCPLPYGSTGNQAGK